ncbi:hypothetical protein RQP46_011458 [Phenoliferia psychrophenolica]
MEPAASSSTQALDHKPLEELDTSVAFLAKRGPLQFPLPTNSLCYPGHEIFRLHALAAARQRGFSLSISEESTFASFHLHCTRGSNVHDSEGNSLVRPVPPAPLDLLAGEPLDSHLELNLNDNTIAILDAPIFMTNTYELFYIVAAPKNEKPVLLPVVRVVRTPGCATVVHTPQLTFEVTEDTRQADSFLAEVVKGAQSSSLKDSECRLFSLPPGQVVRGPLGRDVDVLNVRETTVDLPSLSWWNMQTCGNKTGDEDETGGKDPSRNLHPPTRAHIARCPGPVFSPLRALARAIEDM